MKRIALIALCAIACSIQFFAWLNGGPLLASRGEYWKSPCAGCSDKTRFELALWGPHELDHDIITTKSFIRFVERPKTTFNPLTRYAQLPMTGAGLPKSTAAGGSSFPGDVQSGYKAFWGVVAVTAATRGNRVLNACDNTGSNCQDMVTDGTTGIVVPVTLIGGTPCPGTNCRVHTLYDQLPALNSCTIVSGSVPTPCDLIQTTAANMPSLLPNKFGSNPGIVCTSANSTSMHTNNGGGAVVNTIAQPGSLVAAVSVSSVATNASFYGGDSSGTGVNGPLAQSRTTGKFKFIGTDGSFTAIDQSGTLTLNQAYGYVGILSGASSSISIDGTTVTNTIGGNGISNAGAGATLCNDEFTELFDGAIGALGIANVAVTIATVNSNLHSILGF